MEGKQNIQEPKRVLSMIQPTGMPTIGNYFGALKNWIELSKDYDCFFAVCDLHAITVRQTPADLRKQTNDIYALLLAIGLDPQKSAVFVQSHVPTHAQLAWILNCYTQFGEMSRMTQFKDKSEKHPENINVGLFAYPSLMAADILLYQAHHVPVGVDQKQHLELTRTVANRFNHLYSETFIVPEPLTYKKGGNIVSLQEAKYKMSKSDKNVNAFISMFDDADTIMRKCKRAVTDSEMRVYYDENNEEKAGINNLMTIYSLCTGKEMDAIENEFAGKGYGDFKVAVGEALIAELSPIQKRYQEIIADKTYLKEQQALGAEKAFRFSRKTLSKVMKKIGFVMP